MAEKSKEKYVVIANITSTAKIVTDHRGAPVDLAPNGRKGDSAMIFIQATKKEDEDMAARKYLSLMANPYIKVVFGPGIDMPDRSHKAEVHSVDVAHAQAQDRIAALRKDLGDKGKQDRLIQARLASAKARATLHLPGIGSSAPQAEGTAARTQEVITQGLPGGSNTLIPGLPVADDVDGLPEGEDPKVQNSAETVFTSAPSEGIAINKDTLATMKRKAIVQIAEGLKVRFGSNDTKEQIAAAILEVLTPAPAIESIGTTDVTEEQ